jgi:hypothetical protein
MKRIQPQVLNKEKLIFLLLTLVCGAAVYRFVATRPVAIKPGLPLASLSGPGAVDIWEAGPELAENDAVRGPRNPMRKPPAPLMPKLPDIETLKQSAGPMGPPPGSGEGPKSSPTDVREAMKAKTSGIEYIGVVLADGKSCALLRTKDNVAGIRVMPGEKIAGTKLSVEKVEPWAVWLSDGQSICVLKNERFSSEQESASRAEKTRKDRRPSVYF